MIMESKIDVKGLEVLGAYEGLLDNVEIVDKDSKIDFVAFLEGSKNTVAINEYKDTYSVYFKSNFTNNLTLIYYQDYNKYPLYNPMEEQNVSMIYNKSNNTLYIESYRYGEELLELEGLNVLSISDLEESLQNEINERIINIVDNNVNNLNLSDEELEEYNNYILEDNENYCKYEKVALRLFIEGKNIDFNSYAKFEFGKTSYTLYHNHYKHCCVPFDDFNIIKAIHNKDLFISEIVDMILNDFKKSIYTIVFKNNKMAEFMEGYKDDKNLNTVRNISTILRNKDMKTLNVTYKRNGKEMTFKVEGNSFIQISDKGFYISSYRICNGNERATFESKFKEEKYSTDIYLLNIEKITYGRKVLYSK